MPLMATQTASSGPIPTGIFFSGSTLREDGRENGSSRTTATTVTTVTNTTAFNSTKLPEPVAGGHGTAMMLVPFGVITVIGLAVVMILYIRKRNRLEKLRLQLMPMYNFDPAEEQDELENEVPDHSRERATSLTGSKTPTTSLGTAQMPSHLVLTDMANTVDA